ncbi:MAG TPA: hypothetical protein VN903_24705 [Polyangia bacterium]|nr:hypothetical protein [Polyangia bacterium]
MAELCVKQGLTGEAIAIYRRLSRATDDVDKRRLYEARIGALRPPTSEPSDVTPMETPDLRVDRRGDDVEIEWRLPPDVGAPALQMLVLRHTPDGIAAEPRTLPVVATAGRTQLAVPGLHSLRVAAGRLREGRFIPILRPALLAIPRDAKSAVGDLDSLRV